MLTMYLAMIDDEVDQLRFEDVYYRYRKQMLIVAQRILHNFSDAEDAIQNAFLGIAKNIKTIPVDEERAIKAYVLTCAQNAALSIQAKNQMKGEHLDISEVEIASNDDVFQKVLNSENYALLLRAISQLEPIYADVLLLFYVHEQSVTQIAELLMRNKETVRKQLYRGKKLLIELCVREGMELE